MIGDKHFSTYSLVLQSLAALGLLQILYRVLTEAYRIRLHAIEEYGRVIHEFDPYFNYRATEYLYEHGWQAFKTWFDYLVWYPLGRPVGTTIYPGMQVTAVAIKNYILPDMSINDICCFVPAWFGVAATLCVFFLTYECTRSSATYGTILMDIPFVAEVYRYLIHPTCRFALRMLKRATGSSFGLEAKPSPITPIACATAAAWIMSIVPAHLLRSIGGGFDNESIAMTAMVLTFTCWTRALRDQTSQIETIFWGVITGLAYFYMVAAWGGYTFVLNLIGLHATVLVVLGRYSAKLHRAYTAFYVVGTTLAVQVPIVGWAPLRSLEQIGPLLAFGGIQLLELCEVIKNRRGGMSWMELWKLRIKVFGTAALVGLLLVYILLPTGYFGPISSRVRGLFVQHTKTGNPLVDSVAEHQAASSQAYFQYLHDVCYLAPIGFVLTLLFFFNDSSSFLLVYGVAAYFFSHKMVRLILLTAPIASVTGGIAVGRIASWAFNQMIIEPIDVFQYLWGGESQKESTEEKTNEAKKARKPSGKTNNKKVKGATVVLESNKKGDALYSRVLCVLATLYLVRLCLPRVQEFWKMSHDMAVHMSHPTIIQKARTQDGQEVVINDYREAYLWLKDNTPEDARIMAWWDYGYQITGIANRTTIADGNTWNHEHIALLGRTLTAPEKEGHRIARHLADYVLVWAGGGGDDIAKSPHLRRIANSVYAGLCREPTCSDFGFTSDRKPKKNLRESLLYKLVANAKQPGVEVDKNRFKEVYTSKYGKVRIYKILSVSKESKAWVADPANRKCDAPGSWFCVGQYPPALKTVLKEKKDFKQLEDFNRKASEEDSEYYDRYQKEYMENLMRSKDGKVKEVKSRTRKTSQADIDESKLKHGQVVNEDDANVDGMLSLKKLDDDVIQELNDPNNWRNSEGTTVLWHVIAEDRIKDLLQIIYHEPELAHARSEDGRGPMWWAHEYGRDDMIQILKTIGVSETLQDSKGIRPTDLSKKS